MNARALTAPAERLVNELMPEALKAAREISANAESVQMGDYAAKLWSAGHDGQFSIAALSSPKPGGVETMIDAGDHKLGILFHDGSAAVSTPEAFRMRLADNTHIDLRKGVLEANLPNGSHLALKVEDMKALAFLNGKPITESDPSMKQIGASLLEMTGEAQVTLADGTTLHAQTLSGLGIRKPSQTNWFYADIFRSREEPSVVVDGPVDRGPLFFQHPASVGMDSLKTTGLQIGPDGINSVGVRAFLRDTAEKKAAAASDHWAGVPAEYFV